ncbi:hypothetical protein [Shewanella sp. UCD-KL12]|uniref:hypothetical protein n=1 Tax=Shewanella sp. UCD-KL12 TaxID=1917163 RepID=UPI0009713A08|nr:hypothetical protein [Shewanella sp. UCD-KL12]
MSNQQQKLASLTSDLPKELSPQKDLWDQIEQRLNVPLQENINPKYPAKRNTSWYLLAASLMLFAVLIGSQLPFEIKDSLPLMTNTSKDHSELIATLENIQLAHEMQVSELKQAASLINWQSSPYSSPVETGIEQLRQAAQQIYQALMQNPTDNQLWQLWLWAQQREIELLRQGQKLPISQHSQGEII